MSKSFLAAPLVAAFLLGSTPLAPSTALAAEGPAVKGPLQEALAVKAALQDASTALEKELVARYGEAQRERLVRGMRQVASLWRPEDGDAGVYSAFVRTHFAGDDARRDALFSRMERILEALYGHLNEIGRELQWQSDLDLGPIEPFDEILAGWDPGAHVGDDLFANKLAFVVLLNFPQTTLTERLKSGAGWTRRQWAEARLVDGFGKRIPSDVNQAIAQASADAARYIAEYNVHMHHLVDDKGRRLFPAGMRLLSHWNLRDELKAAYADPVNGLARQRTIQKVMERIVDQTIPAVVVDNPWVDWNPFTNAVTPAAVKDVEVKDAEGAPPAGLKVTADAEPDRRYATLLGNFRALRKADPFSPLTPTVIARAFDEGRQIPEERVQAMLEAVAGSPLVGEVARLVEKRLGRKLEPFDIWYAGFRPRSSHTDAELDRLVRKRFPSAAAFEKELPVLLSGLGFTKEKAAFLAEKITVDPARGSGHAMGAARRGDKAHLRTRAGKDGMDYKGFNIAVHELGHNVEQTFSLYEVDHWLLNGVPNTAFTEALAFVFQQRDLALLGLARPDEESRATAALDAFWGTYEIAGVALVEMRLWHFLYEHPETTPAELKAATLRIAREVWNRWYAPVFGAKDVTLLGIYSHMIERALYLPDYPVGHMISAQIERQIEKSGNLATEFERMAVLGNIAPDLWMQQATGAPVGPEALIAAAREALAKVEAKVEAKR